MKRFQPADRHTVTPRIITPRPEEVVRFVKKVFRAEGEFQVTRPSEVRIGDSLIMISDGGGLREPTSGLLYVYVENVEETYQRAIEAGAETIELPQDQSYGDRRAMVKDPWGTQWQIASQM